MGLKFSSSWQDKVDLASIRIRAKPLTDNVDLFSGEDVFSGMLTYADVCWHMLTYADICIVSGEDVFSRLYPDVC